MPERKFLSSWKMTITMSVLAWLLVFLEAGLTLPLIESSSLWIHNYMIFCAFLTFVFAFIYMRKLEDFSWLEEGFAFAVVFILVNIFLDYGILFLILDSPIFNVQNLGLYLSQFLLCLLASFVVKKKYASDIRI